MRTILFSSIDDLLPALALLVPIGTVLFQAGGVIQPTTTEIVAFMAGAFVALVVSVDSFTIKPNTTVFQEAHHD